MIAREAQWHELPQVVALIRRHFESTGYPNEFAMDDEVTASYLHQLLLEPNQNLYVALDGNRIVGTLGIQVFRPFFSRDLSAHETFLFVDEASRGLGAAKEMILLAEAWAKDQGTKAIIIGNHPLSPTRVRDIYLRNGYREAQTDFIKRLSCDSS